MTATRPGEIVLLDVTDTRKRFAQHGLLLGGSAVLAIDSVFMKAGHVTPEALGALFVGLAMIGAAAFVHQRWSVTHRGHRIDYRNNPLLGERLYVDGKRAAKGQAGVHSTMSATIENGDGQGDMIVSRSIANLWRFRCTISADPAMGGFYRGAERIPDEQLMAEVKRRGLEPR